MSLQLYCQKSLTHSLFRSWVINASESTRKLLIEQLDYWQATVQTYDHYENLCSIYSIRARIALASFDLNQAEEWLEREIALAQESKFLLYVTEAEKELDQLQLYREKLDERLSPEAQKQEINKYIKDAFTFLKQVEEYED